MMKNTMNELYHHGIKGMRWGVRRYQNPDGTYTEAGLKRLHQKDVRWAKRNYNRVYKKAYKKSKKEFNRYLRKDLDKRLSREAKGGRASRRYMNEYNRKLAEIMNKHVSEVRSPYTNQAVKFIAKRGEIGVHLALAGDGFDMNSVRNGVYAGGRIAYKKNSVNIEN